MSPDENAVAGTTAETGQNRTLTGDSPDSIPENGGNGNGRADHQQALIPALLEKYAQNAALATKYHFPRKCSDTGNAERLFDGFAGHLLYDATRGAWRYWDGRRWSLDETGIARCCARAVVRAIGAEVQNVEDENERKDILKWATRSDASPRIDALLKEAATLPGFAVTSKVFDQDPWLLNVQNGTLDLRRGELGPHNPQDRITSLASVAFDAAAECPVFLRVLSQMMLDRQELVTFLQRFFGYSLTGITREQSLLILHGSGANGKSTLLNAVAPAYGDYASTTPAETFVSRSRPTIPNDIAALSRVRLLRCAESEAGAPLAESLVKSATGGEPLTARFLHGEFFSFIPEFKLLLSTNHRPRVRGTDRAIWRRILLVPFDAVFEGAERDDSLPEKLAGELPGILAWMVRGCIDWQERSLGIPDLVRAVTAEYRRDEDRLGDFLDAHVAVRSDGLARGGELYLAYRAWAEESGEKIMSGKTFGLALQERGFVRERTRAGAIWRGIALDGGV